MSEMFTIVSQQIPPKKDQILQSAQVLFAQFGLRKVTIEDIAKASGVSKATTYKYYKNKTEIFNEVVLMEAEQLLDAIREAVNAEPSVVGKFKAHLMTRIEKIQDLVNFYRVTQESWGDFWPQMAKVGSWILDEETAIIKKIMQQGVSEGELDIERLDLSARITAVTMRSIEFPWYLEAQGITASSFSDVMIDMIYNGIRKR
jgi:AcrR family transcriptional regulator